MQSEGQEQNYHPLIFPSSQFHGEKNLAYHWSQQPQHMIIFFSFLVKSRTLNFSPKEALYSLSLAHLNSQHHCSGTLGPLLSKMKFTWIVLQYWDYLITEMTTKWLMDDWTKQWLKSWAGQSWMSSDLIMLLRTTWNLKLISCLFL